MLILQGGRDYQVTVDDDLSGWQNGLAHRPDVTIRVYDADDHMFFVGSGPLDPRRLRVTAARRPGRCRVGRVVRNAWASKLSIQCYLSIGQSYACEGTGDE